MRAWVKLIHTHNHHVKQVFVFIRKHINTHVCVCVCQISRQTENENSFAAGWVAVMCECSSRRKTTPPEEDWVLFIFLYFGELTQESFTSNKYVCVCLLWLHWCARVTSYVYIRKTRSNVCVGGCAGSRGNQKTFSM